MFKLRFGPRSQPKGSYLQGTLGVAPAGEPQFFLLSARGLFHSKPLRGAALRRSERRYREGLGGPPARSKT
jgi:hypothetical protein